MANVEWTSLPSIHSTPTRLKRHKERRCPLLDDCPPLIGQIPLEALDFVVDPNGQKLIGNPEHGGQQMVDLF
jgi:hypothetical protein